MEVSELRQFSADIVDGWAFGAQHAAPLQRQVRGRGAEHAAGARRAANSGSSKKTGGPRPRPYKANSRMGRSGPPKKAVLTRKRKNCGSTVCGGVEGDVDDGFEFDGGSLFGGGAELPLA